MQSDQMQGEAAQISLRWSEDHIQWESLYYKAQESGVYNSDRTLTQPVSQRFVRHQLPNKLQWVVSHMFG